MLFYPIRGEPDLLPLVEKYKNLKEFYLPKVYGERILPARFSDLSGLRRGAFGIPEPGGDISKPEELELILVPGVLFDEEGFRIGFGGGYYDRFLRGLSVPKVGVAFSFQVVRSLPREPWDVPVDILITENITRRLRDGRS